ncbi:MAG TPA: ribulose-phosphate 3-epimerase [Candidatus Cloacimonadota bacterium]|nr:ribulose-phosphate 3-epimerase [Candidatus Cloacimonadota bacterium]
MAEPLVAASILSADLSRLGEELQALASAGADILHLDIMDGHFVPNLSFGLPLIKAVAGKTTLALDAHLMVTNPADYVKPFSELGVRYFSFHAETVWHSHRLIQDIRSKGMKAGIALNPGTPLTSLEDVLTELDFVLLMSVNPGFSGQSFIPSVLPKISRLKQMITDRDLNTLIQIDGGVTDQNARQLVSAGTDILVSASYIFNQPDYSLAVGKLKRCLQC